MSEARTLYVSRDLKNAPDLIAWAKAQGLPKSLSADDMHVTVAFSRSKVDWSQTGKSKEVVSVSGGERAIEKLGDGTALVLRFSSDALTNRWQELKDIGASWDWPGYKPHVTISYDGDDVDVGSIEPYAGPLEFGPEIFAEVKKDWKPKVAEDTKSIMKEMRQDRVVFDRASARTFDDLSGHLHVKQTNISKATVNPYKGSEIPGAEALGLDANKIYRLLRDPEELAKAASTFHNKPLVLVHRAQSVGDSDHTNRVGVVSNPTFEHPYLKADLAAWDKDAIDGIESGGQRELSCGYGYDPDMTPGVFEGQAYDGVMRNLNGNHVALVREGRAGPDVMVHDSANDLVSWALLAEALIEVFG